MFPLFGVELSVITPCTCCLCFRIVSLSLKTSKQVSHLEDFTYWFICIVYKPESQSSIFFLFQRVDVGDDRLVLVDHDIVHLQHVRSQEVLVAHLEEIDNFTNV